MSGMNSRHVRWLTDRSAAADSGSEVRTQLNKVNLILSESVFGNGDTAAIFIDVSFSLSPSCFSIFSSPPDALQS